MSDGKIGYGSRVRIGVGATPTWTELAFVGDIEMPNEQVDEVEVTHMKSPGRRKQFIAGLVDGGEVGVPMNYIPGSATDTLLIGLKASGEIVQVEITLTADGTPETYAGFLKSYSRTAPVGDKMMATATFRLSQVVV
ncbi:phage tail tube protein [Paracoccus sp. (in: a-proteobacteria)]|uniref:phage tail tube protein n=1 Tax=Paracoccus sp. TaxID=267 RepID=UPI00272C770A|nr:phage tail tube protein [Paracoccus sp. (in: a-proteobacteria)]